MSFAALVGWAILRAAVVAGVCVFLAACCRSMLRSVRSGLLRSALTVALILPVLTPVLLTGYAYSNFGWDWVNKPIEKQLFYAMLLMMRWAPAAVGVLVFAPPPPMGSAARHLLRLRGAGLGIRGLWLGPARNLLIAWLAVFLLVFGDFELASLLVVPTWTVWLFDNQVGGLPLGSSLAYASGPLACEAAVLFAGLGLLLRNVYRERGMDDAPRSCVWKNIVATGFLASSIGVVALWPAFTVGREALGGVGPLPLELSIAREVGSSLFFAVCTAGGVMFVFSRFRSRPALLAVLCVPGLLGPLVLTLAVQAIFQAPMISSLYDTPVPLLAVMVLLLMPVAVVLGLALDSVRPTEALYAGEMLDASADAHQKRSWAELRWALHGRKRVALASLLFFWAYLELMASALLAPTGMTPVTVLLYNLMHYGHSAGLAAKLAVAILTPVALALAAMAGLRLYHRWAVHA